MRFFKRVGNCSLPETECERGSKQRKQVLCLIPGLRITRKVARELHTRPGARNNLKNRGVYRRVRFRSCGTVGYGATTWLK